MGTILGKDARGRTGQPRLLGLACAALGFAVAAVPAAAGTAAQFSGIIPEGRAGPPDTLFDPHALIDAGALSDLEASRLSGGDTRMVLNPGRTRLKVQVIDNEYESRLGRLPPVEVYEIDVHNRIVDTKKAPFMPTNDSYEKTRWLSGLTSRPAEFPAGNWLVTGVKPRDDKYGPFLISTGAVGNVEVYVAGVTEGQKLLVGTYRDTGYAIHANTIPFEYSKTYGCLVARAEDLTKLAETLRKDKFANPAAVQTLRIQDREP